VKFIVTCKDKKPTSKVLVLYAFSFSFKSASSRETRNGLNLLELVVAMSTSGSNMQSWIVACVADTPATWTVSDPLDREVHFSLFMFVPVV
jgi:hypothetical protein